MTLKINWEVSTSCPPRRSWHQQLETHWWSYWKNLYVSILLFLLSWVAYIVVLYSCFLKYSLLKRLLYVSNLDHNHVAVSSSITLYIISSARDSWIVLVTFKSIFSQFLFNVPAGFADFSYKVLWRSYCTSNAFTFFVINWSFFNWTSQPQNLS